jgi:voltage-gated potassium channel
MFVAPIRALVWLIFLGTAYQLVIQKAVEEFRMRRLQERLEDHVIICGFGHNGTIAAQDLLDGGFPADHIVVIDSKEEAVQAAAAMGLTGLLGDPAREDILQQAKAGTACAVIVSVADDPTAVLVTLTVRSISNSVRVIVRVKDQVHWKQVEQAGAEVVISSSTIGGLLLADAVESRHIVPFVNDLLNARGRIALHERQARPEEVGRPTNMLFPKIVVGLERQGHFISFLDSAPCEVEQDDLLLVIEPTHIAGEVQGG